MAGESSALAKALASTRGARVGTLTLRERAKRDFKGDRPHRYAVVRVPQAGFLPEARFRRLLKRLDYFGFKLMGSWTTIREDPTLTATFSTPPIAGSPRASFIFELLPLGILPDRSCEPWMKAVGGRSQLVPDEPHDDADERIDLSAVTGRRTPAPRPDPVRRAAAAAVAAAGAAPLVVRFSGGFWIANAAKADKARMEVFKSAGWLPARMIGGRLASPESQARIGDGAWVTKDPFLAHGFAPFMTGNARKALSLSAKLARRRVEMSNAAEPIDAVPLPAPEGLDYLPYQKAGIRMSLEAGGGVLLADDMGLGKTIQAIGIMNCLSQNMSETTGPRASMRGLVVCQANMKIGWQRELEKWLVTSGITVGVAEGDRWPDTDVVVINYDIAARHIQNMRNRTWNAIVADEAHNLKNPDAQRTVAVLGDNGRTLGRIPLAEGGVFIPMTGTPIPNRPIEIYPLLSALDHDRWGSGSLGRQIFVERYCRPWMMKAPVKDRGRGAGAGEKAYKAVLREDGSSCARELQLRLRASGMVRRMKTDRRIMATLPPKFRQVLELPIQLTREIREELNSAEANFEAMDRNIRDMPVPVNEADLRASFSTEGFDVFQRMAQMQDGGKVDFEAMARIRANLAKLKAPTTASYLLDVLAASAEADRPQKIICFGHHRDALTRIIEIVEAEMPGAVVSYLGGASKRKRQEAVDRLQNDERTRLFVGSIGAASTGLTLTRADRVVFSELDWVPSQIMQAEDRAWRIGQVHNVLVQFLVIPDSLEVKLARSLVAKLDVLANAIGGSPRLRRSLEEIYRAEMGEEVEAADQLPAATGAGAARPGQLALFGAADP